MARAAQDGLEFMHSTQLMLEYLNLYSWLDCMQTFCSIILLVDDKFKNTLFLQYTKITNLFRSLNLLFMKLLSSIDVFT